MTPFEKHVREYRPDSVTAKLSFENEGLKIALEASQIHLSHLKKEVEQLREAIALHIPPFRRRDRRP